MIANAFGGNIIEYDAQGFIGNLDFSNYDYIGYLRLDGNGYTININSNYRYLLIWDGGDNTMQIYGENSSNERIFSYTTARYSGSAWRLDPYILNIKFSSDIVKITVDRINSNDKTVYVYKEK